MLKYTVKFIVDLTFKGLSPFSILRFPLPDLGEKIKQGRIKKLYVKEGDKVEQFEKIADVQSDKQFTEITSPEAGVIKKLHYGEDQVCQVGNLFMQMDVAGGSSEVINTPKEVIPVNESNKQLIYVDDGIIASATVRMYARQHDINLKQVRGTGRKGRILKQDMLNQIEKKNKKTKSQSQSQSKVKPNSNVLPPSSGVTRVVKMDETAKILSNLMTAGNSIPHLYYKQSFDVSELQKITKFMQEKYKKNISLFSLLMKCFSQALLQFPKMNSTYSLSQPFNYKIHPQHNVIIPKFNSHDGLGMQLLSGLQNMSVNQIQTALTRTQSEQLLTQQEVSKGTICVSHIGSIGGLSMNPIIMGSTTCHATIGSLRDLPYMRNGSVNKQSILEVTMGCDHRVLDGATVARFTAAWKDYSETPTLAFLNMI